MHLGVLVEQGDHPQAESPRVQFPTAEFAAQRGKLFLPFQQAQAQLLLGVFDIPAHAFLLAVALFYLQVQQRRNNGRHKQHHRRQRRQHGHPVLALRREPAPPAPGPLDRGKVRVGMQQIGVSIGHRASVEPATKTKTYIN